MMENVFSNIPQWMRHQRHRLSLSFEAISQREQVLCVLHDERKSCEVGNEQEATTGRTSYLYNLHFLNFRRSIRQPRKLHPTSYLDGLRGCAAFVVFLHHSTQAFLPSLRPGWASSPEHLNLLALPVIRVMYSGGAMVSLFFVISGYVLSIKPLQLAYKAAEQKHEQQGSLPRGKSGGETDLNAAYANIASATFRRGPRLMIPCLASTLLTAMLAMLGAFVEGANIGLQRHYYRADTWAEQLTTWWEQSLWFVNPFAGGHAFEENVWTIPIEFKGSLLVFVTVSGLAGRSQRLRRVCIWAGFGYWAWYGHWDLMLFLAGVGLAEWRASRIDDEETEKTRPKTGLNMRLIYSVLVFIAVYLLAMPEGNENVANSPGYITLATTLTPKRWQDHWGPSRWWPCMGAILIVATLDQAGPQSGFQKAFTSRFAQSLGDISFSLYLLHGIAIYAVGVRVLGFYISIFGGESDLGYVVSLVMSAKVFLPFLFWISKIFTEVVDKGAVNLARRIANW